MKKKGMPKEIKTRIDKPWQLHSFLLSLTEPELKKIIRKTKNPAAKDIIAPYLDIKRGRSIGPHLRKAPPHIIRIGVKLISILVFCVSIASLIIRFILTGGF